MTCSPADSSLLSHLFVCVVWHRWQWINVFICSLYLKTAEVYQTHEPCFQSFIFISVILLPLPFSVLFHFSTKPACSFWDKFLARGIWGINSGTCSLNASVCQASLFPGREPLFLYMCSPIQKQKRTSLQILYFPVFILHGRCSCYSFWESAVGVISGMQTITSMTPAFKITLKV